MESERRAGRRAACQKRTRFPSRAAPTSDVRPRPSQLCGYWTSQASCTRIGAASTRRPGGRREGCLGRAALASIGSEQHMRPPPAPPCPRARPRRPTPTPSTRAPGSRPAPPPHPHLSGRTRRNCRAGRPAWAPRRRTRRAAAPRRRRPPRRPRRRAWLPGAGPGSSRRGLARSGVADAGRRRCAWSFWRGCAPAAKARTRLCSADPRLDLSLILHTSASAPIIIAARRRQRVL
jgi:hypothetical protein